MGGNKYAPFDFYKYIMIPVGVPLGCVVGKQEASFTQAAASHAVVTLHTAAAVSYDQQYYDSPLDSLK